MMFIDEFARVYENWENFKETNKIVSSHIVAPKNGVYQTDLRGNV